MPRNRSKIVPNWYWSRLHQHFQLEIEISFIQRPLLLTKKELFFDHFLMTNNIIINPQMTVRKNPQLLGIVANRLWGRSIVTQDSCVHFFNDLTPLPFVLSTFSCQQIFPTFILLNKNMCTLLKRIYFKCFFIFLILFRIFVWDNCNI